MADLVIRTAAELGDGAVEARAESRRAARETPIMRAVLRLFADSGGPVSVSAVAGSLAKYPSAVTKAISTLNDDDLLVLCGDSIELAYPFSTLPTPFLIRRADGRERFTCCAIDALGMAPMLGEDVEVRTLCHHCDAPLRFALRPEGPSPDAHDLMVFVTRVRAEDGRACAVL